MTTATSTTKSREFHQDFPLDKITFDPADNYRWGSTEAMERDLSNLDVSDDDGKQRSSYATLRDSIRAGGVEEPIGLVKRGSEYRIIFGFTRCAACRELGLATIPAFVYSAVSAAEIGILQVQENSTGLKRAVNWVATTRMFERMVGEEAAEMERLPESEQTKEKDGRGYARSAKRIAVTRVCQRLGISESTLQNQLRLLKTSHPEAIRLAEAGLLSPIGLAELRSGDSNKPYTDEFVASVLERVQKTNGVGNIITPSSVRAAVRYFVREINGKQRKRFGANAASPFDVLMEAKRFSTGALRDLSVNVAGTYVAKNRLGHPDATDDAWAKATVSTAWFQILGIAMASGDLPMPDGVENENNADSELPAQAARICRNYAYSAFLRAVIRSEAHRRFKVTSHSTWLHQLIQNANSQQRTRAHEINRSIQEAITEVNNGSLKAMFSYVWKDLESIGALK